jgi:hypothetical protein
MSLVVTFAITVPPTAVEIVPFSSLIDGLTFISSVTVAQVCMLVYQAHQNYWNMS